MKAGPAAASVRHTGGTIKGALISAAIVAALFLVPATTLAGGGGQASASPWIALKSVNGAALAQPTLGSSVAFSTGYPSNVKNPRIEVLCYQGGTLVYGAAGGVTDSFLLGGGGSIWLTVGGPADCTANLFYFGTHAGSQTYNWLASTSFHAG